MPLLLLLLLPTLCSAFRAGVAPRRPSLGTASLGAASLGITRPVARAAPPSMAVPGLAVKLGVDVASARQTISATVADTDVAEVLSIPAGSPLIEVRRVVRDRMERPVEYIRVLYRPDLYRFEMSMRRVRAESGPRWTTTSSSPVPAGGG